jgi:hypothetical protein
LLPSEQADRDNPAQREHKPELKQTSAPIHSAFPPASTLNNEHQGTPLTPADS